MKCILLWTGQAIGNNGERESPSAPLAETSPTRSPQWKQWRATIRPHTFANNVLCTVGLQNGYWKRGRRRYSTQHWRISDRQPVRVFHERENSGLLVGVCSQLQFQLGCKEADISVFSARSSRSGGGSLSSLPFAVCRFIQASGG